MRSLSVFGGLSAFLALTFASALAPISPGDIVVKDVYAVEPRTDLPDFEYNRCGESTFGNITNEASPLVKDCLEMLGQMGPRQTFILRGMVEGGIIWGGGCRLEMRNLVDLAKDEWHSLHAGNFAACEFLRTLLPLAFSILVADLHCDEPDIGCQDVADIVRSAVQKFASPSGRISATGHMGCDSTISGVTGNHDIQNAKIVWTLGGI
jgi:hypothetical protein